MCLIFLNHILCIIYHYFIACGEMIFIFSSQQVVRNINREYIGTSILAIQMNSCETQLGENLKVDKSLWDVFTIHTRNYIDILFFHWFPKHILFLRPIFNCGIQCVHQCFWCTVKPFITTHIFIHATAAWIWSRPFNYTCQLYYR